MNSKNKRFSPHKLTFYPHFYAIYSLYTNNQKSEYYAV